MKLLKSLHFIPGHKERLFKRIEGLGACWYIFDLEDAVPADQKEQARANVARWFRAESAPNCFVRINAPGSADYPADVEMLKQVQEPGLVLPKCENCDSIQKMISDTSRMDNRPRIIALIESFAGLQNIERIAAVEEVWAIGLGLEDMLSELIVDSADAGSLVEHIRLQAVVAARACGKAVVDTISGEFSNTEFLQQECRQIFNLGFDGKFSIHPNQVAVINEAFSPSPEAVNWAEGIIKLAGDKDSPGYQNIGGQIITPPKLKKARRILQAAGYSERK